MFQSTAVEPPLSDTASFSANNVRKRLRIGRVVNDVNSHAYRYSGKRCNPLGMKTKEFHVTEGRKLITVALQDDIVL